MLQDDPPLFLKLCGHLDFRFLGCFYFGVGLDWKKACLKLPALEETDKGSAVESVCLF